MSDGAVGQRIDQCGLAVISIQSSTVVGRGPPRGRLAGMSAGGGRIRRTRPWTVMALRIDVECHDRAELIPCCASIVNPPAPRAERVRLSSPHAPCPEGAVPEWRSERPRLATTCDVGGPTDLASLRGGNPHAIAPPVPRLLPVKSSHGYIARRSVCTLHASSPSSGGSVTPPGPICRADPAPPPAPSSTRAILVAGCHAHHAERRGSERMRRRRTIAASFR